MGAASGWGCEDSLGGLHGGRGALAERLWLFSVPTGTVLPLLPQYQGKTRGRQFRG